MTKHVCLALLLLLAACSMTGNAASEGVKIGFIAPLSGDYAEWGNHIRNGLELALEDANSSYTIVWADSVGCDVATTVTEVRRMILVNNVKYIIGPGCITGLKAVVRFAEENDVLLFSTGLLDEQVFEYRNVVNFATQIGTEVFYASQFFSEQNFSRVGLSVCLDAFCEEQLLRFPEYAEQFGFEIVAIEQTGYGTQDFRSVIEKFKDVDVDVVFMMHSQSQVGSFVKQARELELDAHLHGYYNTNSQETIAVAGSALEEVTATFPLNKANTSAFDARYQGQFGSLPNANSYFVYDGFILLDTALQSCDNHECVRSYFDNLAYEGVSGSMEFEQGKLHRPFEILVHEEGVFTPLQKLP